MGGARLRAGAVLSVTGPYRAFGRQAARALRLWAEWDGGVDLELVDDEGIPGRASRSAHDLGRRVDLLLGPYSTLLANAAAGAVLEDGGLLWNHGGSGSHVERGFPGHVISVLTPTTRYAEPFLTWFGAQGGRGELWIAAGRGRFARQVTRAAADACERAGFKHRRVVSAELVRGPAVTAPWSLFSAGSFEEDTEVANWAAGSPSVRVICAVGAGVHRFRDAVSRHDGVLAVAQWVAGRCSAPPIGPSEPAFLRAYEGRWHEPLDYPGVQAVAAAVLATHCARTAGETGRGALWQAATRLRTTTLFGNFEVDPDSGEQTGHQMVLLRWSHDRLSPV